MTRPMQIGLIVLQSDETLEPDMRAMLPPEVEYLVTRVPSGSSVSRDSLQAMEGKLAQAASLLPRGAQFSAVAYGCTSGTAQIGAATVAAQIKAGVGTPAVTEPLSALIAACNALGVSRIGLVSPYVAAVNDQLCRALAEAGITVVTFASFNEPVEEKVVRIPAQEISALATKVGQDPACEAVFLSCTNLRTCDVIVQIETAIGKPVLSSNQVLAWHLGRLVGAAFLPADLGVLGSKQ